jgi:PhnB protein
MDYSLFVFLFLSFSLFVSLSFKKLSRFFLPTGVYLRPPMKLHTFLNYGGNCEEAFRFYEQHLGGKIMMVMTQAQQPNPNDVPPDRKNAILHARIQIGDAELMGSDVPPERFQPMRSVYLSLGFDSTAEAERVYALLSNGGEIFMPMEETFFAFRFAMLRDKFGTSWMILHERPRP